MQNYPVTSLDPITSFQTATPAGVLQLIEKNGEFEFIDENGETMEREIFIKKYLARHEDGEIVQSAFSKFSIVKVLGKTGMFIEPIRGAHGKKGKTNPNIEPLIQETGETIQGLLEQIGAQ